MDTGTMMNIKFYAESLLNGCYAMRAATRVVDDAMNRAFIQLESVKTLDRSALTTHYLPKDARLCLLRVLMVYAVDNAVLHRRFLTIRTILQHDEDLP